MGYTYDQRKRPQGQQNTAAERTTAPVPGRNVLIPGTDAPQSGPSFDLDAAMQARMANTFGDLSTVRDYTPSVREQAPLQTGPYTGPVTHAISNASPSPMAAGPMQAKKDEQAPESMNTSADIIGPQISAADMDRLRESGSQILTEQTADKIFRLGAGVMAGETQEKIMVEKIAAEAMPYFYEKELAKGMSEEKANEEADILAYKYAYDPAKKFRKALMSDEDYAWYENATENADLNLVETLHKRRLQLARDLLAYRENLEKQRPGEDKGKLIFETSLSDEARNMTIYGRILTSMIDAPGMVEFHDRNAKRKDKDISKMEEDRRFIDKADSLTSFDMNMIKESKYAKSSEVQARIPAEGKGSQKVSGNIQERREEEKMNGTGRPDPCPTPTNSANALRGRRTQRRKRAYNRKNLEYGKTRQRKKTMKMQDLYYNHPERIPGAHLITMDLPRGA